MAGRSLSVRFATLVRPLDDLRAAAKAADGKLNDAFVAAVAGGLQRYHAALGAPVDALRMTMPINVRTEATQGVAGNQFVPARFAVPMTIDDPIERMVAIRGSGRRPSGASRPSPSPSRSPPCSTGSHLRHHRRLRRDAPRRRLRHLQRARRADPALRRGRRDRAAVPFGPLSGAAANVTLLSWLDQVCIGINVDPASVTDPAGFQACLADGFDEVIAAG